MILLIIDTDPAWIAFLQTTFPGATLDPTAPWTLAIVSARLMRDVPAEVWQRGAVVATNSPCASEGIDAYDLGARLYFTKDFAPGKVKAILDGVTMPCPERVEGPCPEAPPEAPPELVEGLVEGRVEGPAGER